VTVRACRKFAFGGQAETESRAQNQTRMRPIQLGATQYQTDWRLGAEHRSRTPRSRDGCESAANLERLVGGAEGVERAPHLRHPVPPRLLRPVIILVAVAVPAQRQRHHLLSPPPHRRRRRLYHSVLPSPLSLSLSRSDDSGRRSRKSTGGRRWKLAAASGNEHWLAAGPWQ